MYQPNKTSAPITCDVVEVLESFSHKNGKTVLRVVKWNKSPVRTFECREMFTDHHTGEEGTGKAKGFTGPLFDVVLKHADRIKELLAGE